MVTEKDEISQVKAQVNDVDLHDKEKAIKSDPTSPSSELVENGDDELTADGWLDILDNKQILKKVIHEGDKQVPRPERGCRVKINLETKIKSTEQRIDSECYHEKEIFVGDCDIFHALDLVLPLMHVNERCQVVVAPRFAYGEKGCEPDVPGNCTLECEVELVSVDWVEDVDEIDPKERFKIGKF